MSRVSVRYAKAIFSLALDKKNLDNVADDFSRIESLIEHSDDFKSFLTNPLLSSKKQVEVTKGIFSGKVENLTSDFLELICMKKRLNQLKEILTAFNDLLLKHRNQLHAEVTSAVFLDDQQLDAIKANLESMTSKSVILNTKEDSSLIGGFKVFVEGVIIDNSVQYQLLKLKEKLVS